LRGIVDAKLRAIGQCQCALGIAARGANQAQTQGLGPLASDQAHATGGGMEQHKVTGFEATLGQRALEQVLGRQAFEHHGRTGLERNRIGQLAHALGGHHTHFAIAAGWLAGISCTVAHLQVRHALAHGFHHTRALHAQLEWHGQGVQAAALVHVNEIQANGFVADADLTRARLTHRDIDQLHDFGTTVLVDLDCKAHGKFS
jgi:hypothetical protein